MNRPAALIARKAMPCLGRAFVVLLFAIALAACETRPTPEERAKIEALQTELKLLNLELASAEKKSASVEGGLLKGLIEARLEVLKTSEALIKQRIHALESGAKLNTEVATTEPDAKLVASLEAEIAEQEKALQNAQAEAAGAGGLIGIMKQVTVATHEQLLAMLRSRYVSAKYGLPFPTVKVEKESATEVPQARRSDSSEETSSAKKSEDTINEQIISIRLLGKRFSKEDYQDFIYLDVEYSATGLDKPTRAIKGVLHLQDLFGESMLRLGWTIEKPIEPGKKLVQKGYGFKFNQFISPHQWVRNTDTNNMKAKFVVESILYADGTRRDF